jgi:spore germination protein YaaH
LLSITLQLWFDDELTLSAKYELASSNKLRGVAMWTADNLDYAGGQRVTSMWQAIAQNFTSRAQ